MEIYKDYMNIIKEAVQLDSSIRLSKGFGTSNIQDSERSFRELILKHSDNNTYSKMKNFSQGLGRPINYDQKLGMHPSFSYLKNSDQTENHYIVSAFIDIKGSTNMFKKFDNRTMYIITDTIIKAGIHTALIFGGYVHRLQGDGMFIYFGDKSTSIDKAVQSALQMVSVYSYFIKNDLKNYLETLGIINVGVRSGLDLGYDDDVLWGNFGIGEISEVTTCSLHTSLASKMQGQAVKNGVVVGHNIKNEIKGGEDLFSLVSDRTLNSNDRYIYRIEDKNFNYTQYDFNWEKFLKRQDFINLDSLGHPHVSNIRSTGITAGLEKIASRSVPYFNSNA
ncbi:hypothetical protein LCGC14_1627530 [marine sediment metagenome]|uniref:Guanylate cyclase domain-containing protein n=1 Tax=marine sediment metagenome TaxID=412755 RepID=A0A0F9KJ83_9ZZZZ